MKRTFSIQVKNNHYILQELNTDGSKLSDDEYYDWLDKYNVTFLEDEELDDIVFEVSNQKVERLCSKDEAKTIYNEVLDTKEWIDVNGDYYIYYVKPNIIFL
jgi:hypothetical protein